MKGVLLVEDDLPLLILGEKLLESLGYRFYGAGNGREALRQLKTNGEHIHLILLDVHLKDESGIKLLPQLQAEAPFLPIVFNTGYTDPQSLAELQRHEVAGILPKPYGVEELAALLERLVGK